MLGLILVYALFAGGLTGSLITVLWSPEWGERANLAALAASWLVLVLMFLSGDSIIASLSFDAFSRFFAVVFLLVTSLSVVSMHGEEEGLLAGLILASTGGMVAVAASTDLLTLFVALKVSESALLMGIALSREVHSREAAVKYFVLTLISAAFLTYGIALYGGIAGSLDLQTIANTIAQPTTESLIPLIFMFAGLGVELAVVPFHIWMPDAYEGSYPPVAAVLSSGSKKSSFAAAFKFFLISVPFLRPFWGNLFLWFALITMTFGNLLALAQSNLRRMLAYSSIGQAGYMMMGFAGAAVATGAGIPQATVGGSLLHVVNHSLLTAALFIAIKIGSDKGLREYDDYKGVAFTSTTFAVLVSVMLLSLAGIPPLGGFWSKFVLFTSVVQAGLPLLTLAAVLNSALSLGYYARWAGYMFMSPSGTPPSLSKFWPKAVVVIGGLGTILLGIPPFAQIARDVAVQAAATLF